MIISKQIITIYPRIYKTEKTRIDVDDESLLYSKKGYEYNFSDFKVSKVRGGGADPTSFAISGYLNALPFEVIEVKVGDKVVFNNNTYYVESVDESDYRNVFIEARA